MMIELQHHFLPFQLLSSSSSVTIMEFRQSALDEPPPPPHPPPPPQLWLQRSSSELPGMEFQSPAPPPTPPLLWLQRHPPPLPGCNDDSETTNVNPKNQRNADKVKEGSKLIWRRKKSPSSSAESSTDISKTKREALSPAIGKWRYSICQVKTTSEAELKKHFQGKKHRSMEAVLKPEGNGSTLGLGAPHEPRVEEQINLSETLLQTLSPINTTKCSDENHAPMLLERKIKSKRKEKEDFAFWCEMCKVGADHESVLESHMNGKKHLSQLLQKQTANVGEVPIQEEVKPETVTKIHSEVDTDNWEVSQPLFSEPPALNRRVFVQGTGVAPIRGRTGAVCSLHDLQMPEELFPGRGTFSSCTLYFLFSCCSSFSEFLIFFYHVML